MLYAREVVEDENGIPYVVRTKFNNGIKYRVTETKKLFLALRELYYLVQRMHVYF